MLSVFLDRSADANVTVVAGYISKTEQWIDFQSQWLDWLHRFGVGTFHMREFAHSVGEYKAWKGQNQKRREFLEGLICIIRAQTFRSFAGSILTADFNAVIASNPSMIQLFGNEFTLCSRACGRDIRIWARTEFPSTTIEYMFEDGDVGKGKLTEIMIRDGFPPPVFRPKKSQKDTVFTPFEAADFAAWEVRKALGQVEAGAEWDELRESMKALSSALHTWSHHSRERLEETVRLHMMDAASGLSEHATE